MLRLLLLGLTPVWGASLRVAPIPLRPAGLQVLAAPALCAPAGLSAPLSGLSLAAPALAAPALSLPVPAVSPRTPLQRLSVPVPFDAPPASDLRAGKDYADRAFEFKLGAQAAPVSVPADAAQPAFHDDGGGPSYPRRVVSFNGQEFPSVALRPNIPVEKELIKAIDASRESILIAVYEFKSAGLLDAVRRARARGVKVRIVLDFRNAFPAPARPGQYQPKRSPEVWALLKEKFDVTVLRGIGEYGINHNKFAVFDGKLAEFGSFNWSRFSENNHYENVVFTDEAERISDLTAYWGYLRGLSKAVSLAAKAEDYSWPQAVPVPPAVKAAKIFNGVSLPASILSPSGRLEDVIAAGIAAARRSVDVSVFAMRSTRIAEALAAAGRRGVRVRVIFDRSQSKSEAFKPFADWLAAQPGVELRILSGPNDPSDFPPAEKAHNKFFILDGALVMTGSANQTKYASKGNFENFHLLDEATDVSAFVLFYEHMFGVGRPLLPDSVPSLPTDAELEAEVFGPPKAGG
jgi:phosphatidylserine/phosphatidylglycerophosphate/cardiolipin synthase-like enzyme